MRELTVALRKALLDSSFADRFGKYHGQRSIHTRRPVPDDATYPLAVVSQNITRGDQDFLIQNVMVIQRDILVFTRNNPGTGVGSTDEYREADEIAEEVQKLFHRKKFSIVVDGHHVIDIVAAGPIAAPSDDENTVGRVVMLTIRLQKE